MEKKLLSTRGLTLVRLHVAQIVPAMLIRVVHPQSLSLRRRRLVNQPRLDEFVLFECPGIRIGQGNISNRSPKRSPNVYKLCLTAEEAIGVVAGVTVDTTAAGIDGLVDVDCW